MTIIITANEPNAEWFNGKKIPVRVEIRRSLRSVDLHEDANFRSIYDCESTAFALAVLRLDFRCKVTRLNLVDA